MKIIEVAIAVVYRKEQVLICRRKDDAHLGGLWEFPGGKIEPGEMPQQCLARELAEEVDITVEIIAPLSVIRHNYPHRMVQLHPFLCAYREGLAKPIGCAEVIWITAADLPNFPFPAANDLLIQEVLRAISSSQ